MKYVKTLTLAFTLTFVVLATAAFAGETNSPPAPPPCAPGETNSPPCPAQSLNDNSEPGGEIQSSPASNTAVNLTDLTETVVWALSLF